MNLQSFTEAAHLMQPQMYHMALAILRNEQDAADAVQETLFRGWKKRYTLRDESLFRPWVMRILINQCYSIGRKKQQQQRINEKFIQNADMYISDDRIRELHETLGLLPDKLRLPVLLYYFDGYSQREIALILDISPKQVKTRIRQARSRLNKLLSKDAVQDE